MSNLPSAKNLEKDVPSMQLMVMWFPAETWLKYSEFFWNNIWNLLNLSEWCLNSSEGFSQVSECLNSSEKIQTIFRTSEFFWIASDWFQKDSAWFQKSVFWVQKESDFKICTLIQKVFRKIQSDSAGIQKLSIMKDGYLFNVNNFAAERKRESSSSSR